MIDRLKSLAPYAGALLIFIVLSFVYFSPVLEGKKLPQLDNSHAIGMSKELVDHEKETDEKSMCTNSMFGGMPSYQIRSDSTKNIFGYFNKFTRLGLPYETVAIVFLYMLGFYLLLLSMKVDPWLSIVGAIAFAFGSYNLIIIIAGHITKTYAIALMVPTIAWILYAYNKNKWMGYNKEKEQQRNLFVEVINNVNAERQGRLFEPGGQKEHNGHHGGGGKTQNH